MKWIRFALLFVFIFNLVSCTKQQDQDAEDPPKLPLMTLHIAALQGNLEAVQQHITAGTDVDQLDAYGTSALVVAATFGRADIARKLIEAGADLEIANNEGSTPLHVAAFLCHPEIVQALLENGADKEARNKSGATALESVRAPFEHVKGVYDAIGSALKPLGLRLDYERIQATRPQIVAMLE